MLEMETRFNDVISEKDKLINDLVNKVCTIEQKMNDLLENFSLLEKEKTKKVEKSIACSSCDFKTNSESGLKIHVKKKHTAVEKEIYPRSCHLCEEKFDDVKEMKKHLLTHSYKKAKYLCDECDFVGKSVVTMEVHIGKKHSRTYDCGLCELETNSIPNLEIHLKTCEAYQCGYYTGCDKRFKTLSELKKHFLDKHKREHGEFIHMKIDRNYSEEVSEKVHDFEKS